MLYLVTGTNGAGKTLNTLKWVRELQEKENRPVAYNGRFEMVADFGWKKIDAKDWQAEPDGTIFLFDECHNDFPVRGASAPVPEYVKMLAEHRRRGFDFFLITQHPQNIDLFIRRLIGSPGWHRHLKRPFGGALVSVIEWPYANGTCEKPGAGKDGTITRKAFPREVFDWYKSASIHTGKKKIPGRVWVAIASFLAVPIMIWGAVHYVTANVTKKVEGKPATLAAPGQLQPPGGGMQGSQRERPVMTPAEYATARAARFAGFPHTAPVYDTVTSPTEAPYPAACVESAETCKCYTQQATELVMPPNVCADIVHRGFFMDWKKPAMQAMPAAVTPPAPPAQPQAGPLVPTNPQPATSPADVVAMFPARATPPH